MPWQRTEPMDERLSFIMSWREDEVSMSELCRRYGVSRKTGYKWVDRYQTAGLVGLTERSRAPLNHPHRVAPEIAEAALQVRRRHPSWGPRKVRAWLMADDPSLAWPAASTLGALFDEAGLTVPGHRREPSAAANRAIRRLRWSERGMDGGFQGLVPNWRWRALRAVHAAGRLEPLFAALPGGASDRHRDGAGDPGGGVPRVWPAGGFSQ